MKTRFSRAVVLAVTGLGACAVAAPAAPGGAPPGGASPGGAPQQTIRLDDRPLEARVAPFKGRNVFFVNGLPIAPQMYSGTEHSRRTWTGRPRQSLQEFTAAGYRIIQTDMWFKYSLRADGTFDMEGVRRQLAGILEVNPGAMIVVRINVSVGGGVIGVYSVSGGRKTVKPLRAPPLTVTMPPFTTLYFDIQDGTRLNSF